MIVWINGAFGAGKTSVARRLVDRLEGASMLDPERIGYVLQRLPAGPRGDFQRMSAWRRGTVAAIRLASKLRRRIVVPMTVVERDVFEQTVGALRRSEDVRHFALLASPDTLRERLRGRGSSGWAVEQIERCTSALADPVFARHVPTDGRSIDDVAGEIATLLDASG